VGCSGRESWRCLLGGELHQRSRRLALGHDGRSSFPVGPENLRDSSVCVQTSRGGSDGFVWRLGPWGDAGPHVRISMTPWTVLPNGNVTVAAVVVNPTGTALQLGLRVSLLQSSPTLCP
jgi:hypothetical protein